MVEYASPDFIPFLARFRSYRRDLSEVDKMVLMSNGMEKLRDNGLMKGLILRYCIRKNSCLAKYLDQEPLGAEKKPEHGTNSH